jgi:hypothetical protein
MVQNSFKPYAKEIDALKKRSQKPRQTKNKAHGDVFSLNECSAKGKNKRKAPERTEVHLPLMSWIRKQGNLSDYVLHIANERKTSVQHNMILKALGVKAGASDLFIAIPMYPYGGFWIELKSPKGKLSVEQKKFLQRMQSIGYKTGVYDNWEKAKADIEIYLSQRDILERLHSINIDNDFDDKEVAL